MGFFSIVSNLLYLFILKGGDFVSVEITAVKKRGRESIFGDSEKVNHRMNGMESPQKDGIKKSKVSAATTHLCGSKLDLLLRFSSHYFNFTFYLLLLLVETKNPGLVHEASLTGAHHKG